MIRVGIYSLFILFAATCSHNGSAQTSYAPIVQRVIPRVVKIYGAGGFRGLEAYQSGFLVSSDGHIVTAWSLVLEAKVVQVVLHNGSRHKATVVGADPYRELAVLKIDASGLAHFDFQNKGNVAVGSSILAFSNLYGVATGAESVSVQHGIIAGTMNLNARRGVFRTPYDGRVIVVDAVTNNPGAAGGVITDRQGRAVGMIGKELRNSLDNTWLNYAIPVTDISKTVSEIIRGEFKSDLASSRDKKVNDPWKLSAIGVVLVPNVLERTPPFVDQSKPGSIAATAGLRSDDLVIMIDQTLVQSISSLTAELARKPRSASISLTVLRREELVRVQIDPKQ